jgi:NAD(P)-dependent dehydrogenase (short-subunit alcohol dehydrogenase family)
MVARKTGESSAYLDLCVRVAGTMLALRRAEGEAPVTHRTRVAAFAVAAVAAGLAAAWTRERYSFRGRVVVITGGSRGLGLEMARLLAAEGARVTLFARDEEELSRAAAELRRRSADVETIAGDVSSRRDVERTIDQVIARHGRLDVLINNAGIIQVGPAEHMSLDDYEAALNVHLRGPLYAMLAAIPHMRRRGGGRIVNVSSIGGKIPVPHLAPYVASKFALTGLSSTLRAEFARDGIRITTASPGLMRTGSPINATMKGRHEREFAWFAIGDAMPGLSMDARRAARQIVEACRQGRAEIILTLPARIAAALYGLMPSTFVGIESLVNALLPAPTGPEGDHGKAGRDSTSAVAPSVLTTLGDRAAARNNELPRPRHA